MIYTIIKAFEEAALRHKAVNTFKYQDQINLQPNNKYYEVVVESDPYFNYPNGYLTLNMNVLGFVENSELETQDIAFQIGLSIINKLESFNRALFNIRNYTILGFTKKTDDLAAGMRFTITAEVPLPIDLCAEPDYFLTDEEYAEKLEGMKNSELDLGTQDISKELDLKPLYA